MPARHLHLPCVFGFLLSTICAAENREWRHYLGDPGRSHYTTLSQITPENVGQLEVAWEFKTGDPGEMQCNPLIIDGVLYGSTASNQVFAVDAATGREIWRFSETSGEWTKTLRGVTYWAEGDDRRILFTIGSSLCAVDARTGRPVETFGNKGRASLKQGLGADAADKWVVSSTPGTLFRGLLIVPTRVHEEAGAAPGSVQAFNVRTGMVEWVFHTIPRPGEEGHETWPPEAHRDPRVGGANSWAGMALDEERGIVFVPTGSAAPDFWGGYRHGQNLYANCLIALDAATGKRLWHYQFVHHDIWDRDLPAPPNLVTVRRSGQEIPAVAQVTKSGHVFVFHRLTGEPLFPIEEVPAPVSSLEGEQTWPTQPRPTEPRAFARQTLTESDINPYAPDRDNLLAQFRHSRVGPYQPFSTETTLLFPGFDGGAEWGGAAVAPNGILYVNATEMAWIARLVETPSEEQLAKLSPGHRVYTLFCIGCHGAELQGNPASGFPSLRDIGERRSAGELVNVITNGKGMMPGFAHLQSGEQQALVRFLKGDEAVRVTAPSPATGTARTPYKLDGYVKFLTADGYPAVSPPWGTLSAIDLNTGEYLWQVLLGEFKELTARGIPQTGAENYGGPIITENGLLFIGATKDGMFRAFDRQRGTVLWETELPAPGFATPATYEAGGRQFIVIACGGTKLGTAKGESYVAFALPANSSASGRE